MESRDYMGSYNTENHAIQVTVATQMSHCDPEYGL